MWVIGGLNASNNYLNDVWSTSDGSNWTQVSSSAGFSGRYRHKITVLNGKMWVMGGYTAGSTCINGSVSDVWSSSDGSNWTQVTTSAAWKGGTNGCHRNSFGLVPFNEKLWVIGGYDGSQYNDTWYSSDGSSWTQSLSNASFSARHGHAVTVFDNKVWVIAGLVGGGRSNDVWYSTDP